MPNRNQLQQRADMYHKIRAFFVEKQVMEVETPLLYPFTVTDPHIESFAVPMNNTDHYYLQTSPEYGMKRLLAQGSGSIYQISKAFRCGESGQYHNPEFSMLEWYRPGYDHHDLMDELDEMLQEVCNTPPAEKISYYNLFMHYLEIDPFTVGLDFIKGTVSHYGIDIDLKHVVDVDMGLQLLISHIIGPMLGAHEPLFLYDFPPKQAALSKIRPEEAPVAERFELYMRGSEMANGFHELTDPVEQENRFVKNQVARKNNGQVVPDIDYLLIDALKKGLPPCAGVAVGLDRLLMYYSNARSIEDVISFPLGA